MSEVLGTILILALTVVLFSSIFFFVSTFPKPATQPTSQFQGQLYYSYVTRGTHTWTNVSFLTITHLGGPVVYNFNTMIYVVSQAHPQNTTAVYNLGSGGIPGGNAAAWGTGQVWNLSLGADHLTIPDNITVTVVSSNSVIYRQTLPGSNPTIPPIFDQEGTSPATPVVSAPFSIFVQITDSFLRTTSKQVYINITTPGLTCVNPLSPYSSNTTIKLQMAYNGSNGLWFLGGCSTATSGTYYVTAWVTDANPIQTQTNSIIFPVTVSTTSSGGGSTLVQVAILTNTSAPVINQALNVTVTVTNNGAVSGTASVSYGPAAGFSRSSASGTVPAGATVGFQSTYTPTAIGSLLLNATAAIPGLGTGSDSLALTVFPHIVLIAENVPAGTVPTKSNESANLASELAAAGFPFTTVFVPCTTTTYSAAVTGQFTSGSVAIVDFGSNSSFAGSCLGPGYNATSPAVQITTAFNAGTSFWVVGQRAFAYGSSVANCETANFQAYLQIFGIKASAGACSVTTGGPLSTTAANAVTYTASSTLYAAGINSPIGLNGNLTGTAGYTAYKYFALSTAGGTNKGTSFMVIGGNSLGVYFAGTSPKGVAVATGTDPAQFGDAPAGSSWNAIGAEVAYNVVNYLAKLTAATGPSRAGTDFGVAGALMSGTTVHTTYNSFLVNLRANDISNGILTVELLVNGVPATYQGNFVTATVVESGNGANSWVTLTW
ncbi:MAG: type IV pilin N-terminal domain-containing protein, partial [Thermoplasmata archaeon]